jgi:hypothetical protein
MRFALRNIAITAVALAVPTLAFASSGRVDGQPPTHGTPGVAGGAEQHSCQRPYGSTIASEPPPRAAAALAHYQFRSSTAAGYS